MLPQLLRSRLDRRAAGLLCLVLLSLLAGGCASMPPEELNAAAIAFASEIAILESIPVSLFGRGNAVGRLPTHPSVMFSGTAALGLWVDEKDREDTADFDSDYWLMPLTTPSGGIARSWSYVAETMARPVGPTVNVGGFTTIARGRMNIDGVKIPVYVVTATYAKASLTLYIDGSAVAAGGGGLGMPPASVANDSALEAL